MESQRWRRLGLVTSGLLVLGAMVFLVRAAAPSGANRAAADSPLASVVLCNDLYLGSSSGPRIGKSLSRLDAGSLSLTEVTYFGQDTNSDNVPDEEPDDVDCQTKATGALSTAEQGTLIPSLRFQILGNQLRPTASPDPTFNDTTNELTSSTCVFDEATGKWTRTDTTITLNAKSPNSKNTGTGSIHIGTSAPAAGNPAVDPSTCVDQTSTAVITLYIASHVRDARTDLTTSTLPLENDGPHGNPVPLPQTPDTSDAEADDWDGDGCTDWDELSPTFTAGIDPFNPHDCDTDYSGVFDTLITAWPATWQNGNVAPGAYTRCISRATQNGNDLDNSLVCYLDAPAMGNSTTNYLAHVDGLASGPPPPPYAPAGGQGQGTIQGDDLTGDGCVVFEGTGLYTSLVMIRRTLVGQGEAYLFQDPTNCMNETPSGSPVPSTVAAAEQNDDADYDKDGCLDADELELDASLGQGYDPFNPNDCDDNLNGIFYTLTSIVPQQPCKNQLPSPDCDGQPDGQLAPGAYLGCVSDVHDVMPAGPSPRVTLYCYTDIPGVDVNPHVAGASGDGRLLGSGPPVPPYGEVHNTQAVLTPSIVDDDIQSEGCIANVHGPFAPNIYVRTSISTVTGQGSVDIWNGRPDCSNPNGPPSPDPTPSVNDAVLYSIEQGKGVDTDGDNCTDEEELSNTASLGGLRDPLNWGDFMSVHTGPASNLQKDNVVAVSDISAVVARFGTNDSGGAAPINRNTNPKTTPPPMGYHPSFDRGGPIPNGNVAGSVRRQYPANVGSGAGSIAIADISAVVAQFGHSCAGLP